MKPVLIQNLIKHNKGKYKATALTEEDRRQHDRAMGKFIFWFVTVLFFTGIILS